MKRFIVAILCGTLLPAFIACAEEPAPGMPPPKHPPKKTPKDKAENADPEPDPDSDDPFAKERAIRYILPEGADSDDLVDFCQRLQDYEPEDDDEAKVHETKLPQAVKRACKRILELEKDKESDNARFARRNLLTIKLDKATDINAPKMDALFEKVRDFLASPNLVAEDADVASALDDFLSAHASPKATEWSKKIGSDLLTRDIPEVVAVGKILLSTAKRLNLVGKPLQLKGTTIDGEAFDLAQWKNKVVLVEIWASWCAHCVDGMPILKNSYEQFHGKGFEIVGISADEDRNELVEFLKDEKLPWITLYEPGGKHPALDEFGINAFPTTLLIGKDGSVIALDLRDDALDAELEKQFGISTEPKSPKKIDPAPKAKPKKEMHGEVEEEPESIDALKKKYTF